MISCLRRRGRRGRSSGTRASGRAGGGAGRRGWARRARLACAELRLLRAARDATSTCSSSATRATSTSPPPGAPPAAARRLQPARLAVGHVRRRPRALPARLACPRGRWRAIDRPRSGPPTSSSPTRRPTPSYLAGSPAFRQTDRGLPRRRRGAPLPAGLVAAGAVHVPVRRQADPAARPGDDPRRRARWRRSCASGWSAAASSSRCSRSARRTSSGCRWVEYERLPGELHRAGCALGIFGDSAKAQRVIPNKAFQALACGTPLVTADTPAARELLVDGESALLVPPGDPEALAAALRRLAGDPELARRLARGGRRRLPRARERGGPRRPLARAPRASICRTIVVPMTTRRLTPAILLWAAIAAYAAGFSALSVLRAPRLPDRALRPRQHGAGGLVDGARPPARDDQPARRADLAAGRPLRPDPRRVRAALARCGRARTRCSSPRRSRSRSVRCRSSGSPASTSARTRGRLGFALAYLLLPADEWLTLNEFHPVALALPAAAVRVLVPGRGPPRSLRALRARRGDQQGGDRARRRRARALVRAGPPAPTSRARDRRRRGRRLGASRSRS